MTRAPAPRLRKADYVGRRAYFLTICTFQRLPLLATADIAESLLTRFRQCTTLHHFANHAYAFMPDHAHFVVEGQRSESDLCEVVRAWKSQTAFEFKRRKRQRVWQRSFYDRVMRDGDEMAAFARYVVDNPSRAGLCEQRCIYPFVGSDTMTVDEIRHGRLS